MVDALVVAGLGRETELNFLTRVRRADEGEAGERGQAQRDCQISVDRARDDVQLSFGH